jgi:hypothetical protein
VLDGVAVAPGRARTVRAAMHAAAAPAPDRRRPAGGAAAGAGAAARARQHGAGAARMGRRASHRSAPLPGSRSCRITARAVALFLRVSAVAALPGPAPAVAGVSCILCVGHGDPFHCALWQNYSRLAGSTSSPRHCRA